MSHFIFEILKFDVFVVGRFKACFLYFFLMLFVYFSIKGIVGILF